MRRAWPVIKREFTEMVRTKMYIIGTLLGPLLIAIMYAIPILMLQSGGGGVRDVVILDATGTGIGQEIAKGFDQGAVSNELIEGTTFRATVQEVTGDAQAERQAARGRITADNPDLDGYLYLPAGFIDGAEALYEGRNATSMTQTEQMASVIRNVVRQRRMATEGVPAEALARVMAPVRIENRKPGSEEEEGSRAEISTVIGFFMGFLIYFSVTLFAQAVMRGVMTEKRDRVVEVLLSSVNARAFISGKVLGIGGASLLQIGVWIGFAAAALKWGPGLAAQWFDAPPLAVPPIPGGVVVAFLFFFATGFLLYSALFAVAGAVTTSDQEANQMLLPVQIPLILALFTSYAVIADPDSSMAVAGTLIPFFAPVVVPIRAMMTDIPTGQYLLAGVLMVATVAGVMWAAAKIYHIGVLSTGKRPSMKELVRWLRTA